MSALGTMKGSMMDLGTPEKESPACILRGTGRHQG